MKVSDLFVKWLENEGVKYIFGVPGEENEDSPELFCLCIDHILKYEHGSPELSDTLGEILNLYETVKKDDAALYGIIGTIWELKETELQLPLTIEEMKKCIPTFFNEWESIIILFYLFYFFFAVFFFAAFLFLSFFCNFFNSH